MKKLGLLGGFLALLLISCVEQKPQTGQTQVQRTITSSYISYPPSSRPAASGGEAGKLTLIGELKEFQGDCGIRFGFDNQADLVFDHFEISYRAEKKNGDVMTCKDAGRAAEGGQITCSYVEPAACSDYKAFVVTKIECSWPGTANPDCTKLAVPAGTPLLKISP